MRVKGEDGEERVWIGDGLMNEYVSEGVLKEVRDDLERAFREVGEDVLMKWDWFLGDEELREILVGIDETGKGRGDVRGN
jgi:hypothetical protein